MRSAVVLVLLLLVAAPCGALRNATFNGAPLATLGVIAPYAPAALPP